MQDLSPQDVLRELIDRAAKNTGTKAALARQLGVPPTRLNEWRGGHRPCPPEIVAIIADIAGMPGEEWLARASLWYAKEKPYYDLLVRAVGKYAPPTTGAAASCSLVGALVLACTEAGKVLQCVLC